MIPLHREPHFTLRFDEGRIIPGFHLEGVGAGRRVSVFKLDPATSDQRAAGSDRHGDGNWVDLPKPIIVRAGEGFVAVPEEDDP